MLSTRTNLVLRARRLLSKKSRWVKGTEAKDAFRRNVRPTDPSAQTWCATGALFREASRMGVGKQTADEVIGQLTVQTNGRGPVEVNDNDGWQAVIDMFDDYLAERNVDADTA